MTKREFMVQFVLNRATSRVSGLEKSGFWFASEAESEWNEIGKRCEDEDHDQSTDFSNCPECGGNGYVKVLKNFDYINKVCETCRRNGRFK